MPNINARGEDIGDPLGDEDDAVWVTNKNGGTHSVPASWVTKDEVGDIRVRGNAGFKMAEGDEKREAEQAQAPERQAGQPAARQEATRPAQDAPKRS